MNRTIKQFAENFLRPVFPRVSRRLLDDLAERVVIQQGEKLKGLSFQEINTLILEEFVPHVSRLSAVFSRQSGHQPGHQPAPGNNQSARSNNQAAPGNNQSIEIIYLVRDEIVGNDTSVDRLAELLANGIEEDSRYNVDVRPYLDSPPPSWGINSEQIRILIITSADSNPNPNRIQRLLEKPPHRVVYVTLPVVTLLTINKVAKDILHEDLTSHGEAHFCSFIPTIITRKAESRNTELEVESVYDRTNLRFSRDKTVLTASTTNSSDLPDPPLKAEIDRWVRNVMNKQIGFASSGGGASAYRLIALIRLMYAADPLYPNKKPMPIDVFSGLSGGSLIGAYLAGNEPDFFGNSNDGLKQSLARGDYFARRLPQALLTTRPIQEIVDQDLNYQQVGDTSVRFHAVTTHMSMNEPPGTPPQAMVVVGGSLGQAVRASSALPLGFAPTMINGKRYTDGMASTIVPSHVTIDHGADVVIACNCLPGPDSTNPFSNSQIGRFVYNTTILGRYIDMFTWINFMVQNASHEAGHWVDAYFQFEPASITSFEFLRWGDAYKILEKAYMEKSDILAEVQRLQEEWERIP